MLLIKTIDIFQNYLKLTKPRIIPLLLITAIGGMLLAAKEMPDITIILTVLIAGSLASGGASSINQYLEHDIDTKMSRTNNRPIASGNIRPINALIFGIALNLISLILFVIYTNLISGLIAISATLFYVVIYTMILKRSTHQNIVIGGAAGALPPIIGWTSVTGSIGMPAILLFLIIFLWTPPHFWALSLILKDDYAAAKIPMLPVVHGIEKTKKEIFKYSIIVFLSTLSLIFVKSIGLIYIIPTFILGIIFIYLSWDLLKSKNIEKAKRLFFYSMLYLSIIFLAIMIDSLM
ncbi:MAG: protoheme IX farnesyltransferase [Chloroflexi bacterium]|nr:protoheme IX farnesyltransferase [Chloroflexota bacterium]|tara:strand:+ start:3551 stop:4426 length:876 start_codon:yes stop_codon:yes gene_type:complete